MRSNVLSEYASACQFLARLASGIFLTGFEDTFSTTCDYQTMAKLRDSRAGERVRVRPLFWPNKTICYFVIWKIILFSYWRSVRKVERVNSNPKKFFKISFFSWHTIYSATIIDLTTRCGRVPRQNLSAWAIKLFPTHPARNLKRRCLWQPRKRRRRKRKSKLINFWDVEWRRWIKPSLSQASG